MSGQYRNPDQKRKGPCKRCQARRERIARAVDKFTRKFRKGSK